MTANPGMLRSCVTGGRNCATFYQTGATPPATATQQKNKISLKALADGVVKRNLERNQCATKEKNTRNFLPKNDHQKLRKLRAVSEENIGTDAVQNCATSKSIIVGQHPCPLCGGDLNKEGLDGCVHGTDEVPYPEPVIDGLHPCSQCGEFFYEGSRGGYFCKRCQGLPEGVEPVQVVRGITPRGKDSLRGDAPDWFTPGQDGPQRRRTRGRLSPLAIAWLRENKAALKATGWTTGQLWRRNKARGICWMAVWDRKDIEATLHHTGKISVSFGDGGKKVIQSARPMPQRNTQRNAELRGQTK